MFHFNEMGQGRGLLILKRLNAQMYLGCISCDMLIVVI